MDFLKLGWRRSLKVVSRACEYLERLRHAIHDKNKTNRAGCCMCTTDPSIGLALRQVMRVASRQAEAAEGKQMLDKEYTHKDGLWFCSNRLNKEGCLDNADVDAAPFFDSPELQKVVPIVMVRSCIFQSYMWYVHDRLLNHPRVELTLREVVLGQSAADKYVQATDWVDKWQQSKDV